MAGDDQPGSTQSQQPLAAQIPLQSFDLPTFPPEASRLRQLTLTSDIKLDEYQTLISQASLSEEQVAQPLPVLPQTITTLNLELFHLGFPGDFLTKLATGLPNLRSVTFFSCLIDGLTADSRGDAERFFTAIPLLRDLHIIDSFARPGFWKSTGKGLENSAREMAGLNDRPRADSTGDKGEDEEEKKRRGESFGGDRGVKVVDVSFTYRGHEDEEFMGRVGAEELVNTLVPGCVGWSCRFLPMPPPEQSGQDNGSGSEEKGHARGILPFASDSRAAMALRKRFENLSGGELSELKVLNLNMYTLKAEEVGHIVYSCSHHDPRGQPLSSSLVALTVSVLMEKGGWFDELLNGLTGSCQELQSLEVVGVPSALGKGDRFGEAQDKLAEEIFAALKADTQKDGKGLRAFCPQLKNFEMSILMVKEMGRYQWDGEWKKL